VTGDREMGIRMAALDRAIQAWEKSGEFVRQANGADLRTDRILATAAKFETYLRGPSLGARQEGDPEPHVFVNDGSYCCTVCEEGEPSRWHLSGVAGG
jgi:hypothetical protein